MNLSIPVKIKMAHSGNYGSSRPVTSIKYIVVHYTANDGDTDEGNGNYFANNVLQVSAHYFVDDDSVTHSVPDSYIAWHCGAKQYKHRYCRNANSIGVEICDDVKNGIVYPSQKTINNALELVRALMKKYNVPKENVLRHYDVTGKLCPMYWSGSAEKDAAWRTEFWNKLDGTVTPVESFPYVVKMTQDSPVVANLNTTCKKNYKYTIVAEKTVGDITYGKLKSGAGWVNLSHTSK